MTDQQQLFQHFRLDNLGTSGIQPRSGYFHLFPTLKHHLSGHKFASEDDVKTAIKRWLKSQDTEFYDAWINKRVPQLNKYLDFCADYVEKQRGKHR